MFFDPGGSAPLHQRSGRDTHRIIKPADLQHVQTGADTHKAI